MSKEQKTAKTYAEKLRDPRWQKKRLEVMERDKFCCRRCYDRDSTLNVHHFAYRRGLAPWEYRNNELVTLCEDCHKLVGSEDLGMELGRLRAERIHPDVLNWVSEFVRVAMRNYPSEFYYPPQCERVAVEAAMMLLVAALSESQQYSLREELE